MEGVDMDEETMTFGDRLKHAWNAFRNKDPIDDIYGGPAVNYEYNAGPISYSRPDRHRISYGTDKTIAVAIYNRLATDCTRAHFEHVRVNEDDKYQDTIDSGLNYILNYEANIDQSSNAFFQDLILSMLDEGVVAAVPIDTTMNPNVTGSYDIQTMRVGKILSWYPKKVQVEVYNEETGQKVPLILDKSYVAIIENPFYSVMNEDNSVLKRLVHKLSLLDSIDDDNSSGKLDLIIQLPYVIKSEARKRQAEERRKQIEEQLEGSKYGIAYTDGTERITQLNRAVENNLMSQIEYLTSMLYSQLGLTKEIMDGTANEQAMLNYYNRTINVILDAVADEFERKFLTKTARSQRQAIMYFRDPFALTPSSEIADIADKFTRNEVLAPDEVRSVVGFKPSGDPKSEELRNRNLYEQFPEESMDESYVPEEEETAGIQNGGENYEV